MKKEVGISIIEIVISIIILILIAFFAIYNAQNSLPKAKATELYKEMKSVQTALEFVRTELATKNDFQLEALKQYDDEGEEDNTYIIYGKINHPYSNAAKFLGIENLKRDYLYTISDDRVDFMLVEPVDIQGTEVATLKQVESILGISK